MSIATYLLDTDTVIGLLRDRPRSIRTRFRRSVASGAAHAMSSVVLFELAYGIARSGRAAENRERLRTFLAGGVVVLPFSEADARSAGALRADLANVGTTIGPYDLLIAGQARARGAVLVSGNVREFARVAGLQVEDWGAAG